MTFRARLWLLFSQSVNAILFGGEPDESLSARAWRTRNTPWGERMHARIDSWLGAGHCRAVRDEQVKREQSRNGSTAL
jgi:hypothetical protein